MLPVDIFNQSSEYPLKLGHCQHSRFLLYLSKQSFFHSAKQSYQTILARAHLYIYTTENKTGWSKYPSIFPGSSILPFSSVPVTVSSNHEIDNGRAKKSGYGFLGIAGFFDRLSPSSSFQPRSSQLHREEKFNFSSSTLIYPHAGDNILDIYTDELVVARFIFTDYLSWIAVSIPSSSYLLISLHVYLKCVICIPSLQETSGHWTYWKMCRFIYWYCGHFAKFIPNIHVERMRIDSDK